MRMKKLIALFLTILTLSTFVACKPQEAEIVNSIDVSGMKKIVSTIIPNEMAPHSVIMFVSDTEYVILEGEPAQEKVPGWEDGTSPYRPPYKGLKVFYDGDGFVTDGKKSNSKYAP